MRSAQGDTCVCGAQGAVHDKGTEGGQLRWGRVSGGFEEGSWMVLSGTHKNQGSGDGERLGENWESEVPWKPWEKVFPEGRSGQQGEMLLSALLQ